MSLILDALKQAERERRIGRPPDVGVALRMKSRTSPRRWPWFLTALVIIGALLALMLRPESPVPTMRKTSEAPADIVSRDPGKEAGVVGTVPFPRTPERKGERPQGSNRSAALKRSQNSGGETVSKPFAPPRPSSYRGPDAGTQIALNGSPDRLPPSHKETSAAAREASGGKTEAEAPAEEKLPGVPEETLPFASELPPDIRATFQELDISAHVYNEDPSGRFVFINEHSYHAGDRILDTELILNEITPEGIVIDYGKGRARVPAKRSSLW